MEIFLKNRLSFNYEIIFLLHGPPLPFGNTCGLGNMRVLTKRCRLAGAWAPVRLGDAVRPALFQVNGGKRGEVSLDKLVLLAPVSWPRSSLGNDDIRSILSPLQFSNRSPFRFTPHGKGGVWVGCCRARIALGRLHLHRLETRGWGHSSGCESEGGPRQRG